MRTPSAALRLAVVAAIAVTGCASVQNIPLDTSGRSEPVRSVVLLRVSESRQFTIHTQHAVAGSFGLIGGALQASKENDRTQAFLTEYNRSPVKLGAVTAERVQAALRAAGLAVSYAPTQTPALVNGEADYGGITTKADVILNVWFGTAGYIDATHGTPAFEPQLIANARLLDARTKATMFQRTYVAGYPRSISNSVFVPCASDVRFESFDALMATFPAALEGLVACDEAVVSQLAEDLRGLGPSRISAR